MGDFSFDPATGQQGTSLPVPGQFTGTPYVGNGYVWNPKQYPNDPHNEAYTNIGDAAGDPVDGPQPENIHGERSLRAADDLDGDDDPHDQDSCDPESCGDDCDDDCESDWVASNIVTSDNARGNCGPRRLAASNHVILPTLGRPQR